MSNKEYENPIDNAIRRIDELGQEIQSLQQGNRRLNVSIEANNDHWHNVSIENEKLKEKVEKYEKALEIISSQNDEQCLFGDAGIRCRAVAKQALSEVKEWQN
jgi:hypothetical protein